MSSKLFGERARSLTAAGTINGTKMIVKALADSQVIITAAWGPEDAEVTLTVDIPAMGTVEGVDSVEWVSGSVVCYS